MQKRSLRIQKESYPDCWYWLVYYCGTLSSRLSCILWNRYLRIQIVISGLILTSILLWNLVFKIELYLVKQIPENTDRVVSGFILTKVLLRNPEFEIKTDTREYRKLHLKRYGSKRIYWSRAFTSSIPSKIKHLTMIRLRLIIN